MKDLILKKILIIFFILGIGFLIGLFFSLQKVSPSQKTVDEECFNALLSQRDLLKNCKKSLVVYEEDYQKLDLYQQQYKNELQDIAKEFEELEKDYQEHTLFYDTLIKISRREPTENYKCIQFSEDLVKELAKIGIKSEIIYGELDGKGHAWVGIWIEPMSGMFIKTNENYKRSFLNN